MRSDTFSILKVTVNGIKPIKSEEYNSNNAWGFGGFRGTKFTYESGAEVFLGWACTRHRGAFAFHTVTDKTGCRRIDRSGLVFNTDDPVIIGIITNGL